MKMPKYLLPTVCRYCGRDLPPNLPIIVKDWSAEYNLDLESSYQIKCPYCLSYIVIETEEMLIETEEMYERLEKEKQKQKIMSKFSNIIQIIILILIVLAILYLGGAIK
jgi:hypothetical protein